MEIGAEGVLSGAGDHRGGPAQACGGHRDVGRRAAEELPEGLDLRERHTRLQGIQIDADASHGDDVEGFGVEGFSGLRHA